MRGDKDENVRFGVCGLEDTEKRGVQARVHNV